MIAKVKDVLMHNGKKVLDFFKYEDVAFDTIPHTEVSEETYSEYVIIDQRAIIKSVAFASMVMKETGGKEMMGFIAGTKDIDEETQQIKKLYVEDVIFTGCKCDHSATEMDVVQMRKAIKIAKEKGLKILGWVHSHPGFCVNPSSTDTTTNETWEVFMKHPLMLIVNENEFYVGTTIKGRDKKLPFIIKEKKDCRISDVRLSELEITEKEVSLIDEPVDDINTHLPYVNNYDHNMIWADQQSDILNPFFIWDFFIWIGDCEIRALKYVCNMVFAPYDYIISLKNKIFNRVPPNQKIEQLTEKLKEVEQSD